MTKCRECGSSKIDMDKVLHGGYAGKETTYHYKLKCLSCGVSYFTKRDETGFLLTKNKAWESSAKRSKMLSTLSLGI